MTLSRGWLSYVGQNGSGGGGNGRRRKGRISSKTLSSMPASCWTRSRVVSWPSLKRIWNIISRANIWMQPKIHHSAHQVMCHAQFPQGPHSIPPNPGCVRLETFFSPKKGQISLSTRSKLASIQTVQELPTSDKDLVEAHAGCVEEPIHSSWVARGSWDLHS